MGISFLPPSRLDLFSPTLSNSNRHHEAPLGLHQEEQPAGSRQQAVLHPRQEDGQGLRLGQDARLRHGQAHRSPPLLRLKKTRRRTTSRICLQHFLYQVVEYKLNLADEIFNRTTLFRLPLTVTAIKCE